MGLDEVVSEVQSYGVRHVTLTGGEPLAQPASKTLLKRLCELPFVVSLETSGAISLEDIDPRVVKVVDIKTPDSGESHQNLESNVQWIRAGDQIKFVICSRADYDWSRSQLDRMALPDGVEVLFSPSHEQLDARSLADWIVADRLPVRFQIQLHKYLWGDEPGR